MSFGMRVINGQNFIQIDEGFSNYEITAAGQCDQRTLTYYPETMDNTNLVFVRPHSSLVKVAAYGVYPGGSWPAGTGIHPPGNYFITNIIRASNDYSPVCDYFVAARSSAMPGSSDFGMRTWDADGGLVFDSNRNYLKIMGAIYAELGARYPAPPRVYTLDLPTPSDGKKYYVCLNPLLMTAIEKDSTGEDIYGYTAQFVTDTRLVVRTRDLVESTTGGGSYERFLPDDHMASILIAEY